MQKQTEITGLNIYLLFLWPIDLDFIPLQITPFELIYGRKMLPYKDWITEENDVEAILIRTNEIKELFDVTISTKAIEIIRHNQEKQIEIQNNSQKQ
ncbi:unnamed protein product [Brachionus calyciflorus]|uniref:Uncharacterized protein n=1 Tax=Brachionus calyciflorus TaxID=104777 RepID=A0A814IPB7_9BILA|nr:unnamed protein product [Brachionus calyciflorus]